MNRDPDQRDIDLLRHVYAGDLVGGMNRSRPELALRLLEDHPDLASGDPYVACAFGDEARLREATARDPSWLHRDGGPLRLPPLVAVTHSGLLKLPAWRERLHACARFLLSAGASPDQSVISRWGRDGGEDLDASKTDGDEAHPLSALHGAAGQHHDAELTALLLAAGADPNDGESLYHSLESVACTRLLLEAGARVSGTNAMYRVLDLDAIEVLRLLLAFGGDPNEAPLGAPTSDWGSPLLWAIRRRRSVAHIAALLEAGADPHVRTRDGTSAFRMAQRLGLTEVAELLRSAGAGSEPMSDVDAFVAACAAGNEAGARTVLSRHPGLIDGLDERQRRWLPELAAEGCDRAVRLMVELGWPIETRGGDWSATALNMAVFRGDAALTRFLLEHGADWRTEHGFGDNALGTLSWASLNEPVADGDWVGCAQALMLHGIPAARPHPDDAELVLMGEHVSQFSDEVTEALLAGRSAV